MTEPRVGDPINHRATFLNPEVEKGVAAYEAQHLILKVSLGLRPGLSMGQQIMNAAVVNDGCG